MIFSDGRKLLRSMDHLGRRRKDMEEQHERSMQGMLHHLEEIEEEHWLTMQDIWRRLEEMEEHRRSMHDMWRGLDETEEQLPMVSEPLIVGKDDGTGDCDSGSMYSNRFIATFAP
jgi:hypothetical protein